ncbi:MAG: hypothetical protein P4L40_22640 [Terracidiphilus sp.]|nr:hypothetical protein [Terracidiphilus sp.]
MFPVFSLGFNLLTSHRMAGRFLLLAACALALSAAAHVDTLSLDISMCYGGVTRLPSQFKFRGADLWEMTWPKLGSKDLVRTGRYLMSGAVITHANNSSEEVIRTAGTSVGASLKTAAAQFVQTPSRVLWLSPFDTGALVIVEGREDTYDLVCKITFGA